MNAAMRALCAVTCLACAGSALADSPQGDVGIYYMPSSKLDAGGTTYDGHGYGIHGAASIGHDLYLNGQFQRARRDDSGADLDQDDLRLGAGMYMPGGPFFGGLEFVHMRFSSSSGGGSQTDAGVGVHGGAYVQAHGFSLSGELGYLSVGDAGNGLEYGAEAGYDLTKDWSLFAGYRASNLKKDGASLKPSDISVGLRFNFLGGS